MKDNTNKLPDSLHVGTFKNSQGTIGLQVTSTKPGTPATIRHTFSGGTLVTLPFFSRPIYPRPEVKSGGTQAADNESTHQESQSTYLRLK